MAIAVQPTGVMDKQVEVQEDIAAARPSGVRHLSL
jgi:hypothetical protein